MATPKFFAISKTLLRRHARLSLHHRLYFSTHSLRHHFLRPAFTLAPANPSARFLAPYNYLVSRSLSTGESKELTSAEDFTGTGDYGGAGFDDESILPVRALTSLLDGYHDLTGFPWWLVIASSTMALRLTLFPFIVLQLHKIKRIGEVFPKLPPPLPPPLSGRSFKEQLAVFQKERNAVGCPSFLWFFASFAVQVPLFLLWITTIRRMSLDHHPGFDCGGVLWFQNLTDYPNGVLGPIFPLLISGLHYTNVQISFRKSSIGKNSSVFGTLAKCYKMYLDLLTVPMLFITFYIPQGSLIYWLTNSSLSLCQQLVLQNPDIREMLDLPNKAPVEEVEQDSIGNVGVKEINQSRDQHREAVLNLSPQELVALSVKFLAKGQQDRVFQLLRLALEKDPEYVRALLLMGQTYMQKNLLSEAIECLEIAISKLLAAGHPTGVEDVDLLILSSTWAGSVYIRQGKQEEGMAHLERLASIEEPEDSKSKAHYYDGLLLLSSALSASGRKAEAVEHLRRVVAYDPPRYHELIDQCENDEDDFSSDLVSSRRTDS